MVGPTNIFPSISPIQTKQVKEKNLSFLFPFLSLVFAKHSISFNEWLYITKSISYIGEEQKSNYLIVTTGYIKTL